VWAPEDVGEDEEPGREREERSEGEREVVAGGAGEEAGRARAVVGGEREKGSEEAEVEGEPNHRAVARGGGG
jgi:hypothetical protein